MERAWNVFVDRQSRVPISRPLQHFSAHASLNKTQQHFETTYKSYIIVYRARMQMISGTPSEHLGLESTSQQENPAIVPLAQLPSRFLPWSFGNLLETYGNATREEVLTGLGRSAGSKINDQMDVCYYPKT